MRFLPIPDLTELDTYRFWCYVLKKDGCCWDWVSTGGKGSASCARPSFKIDYQHYSVTRLLWKLITGNDPGKLLVLHTCPGDGKGGNKCVNPDHLYLGTHSDNAFDRERDNPNSRLGSHNSCTHLIEDDVKIIRNSSKTHQQLAYEYGVDRSTIGYILNRKTWKHI